MVHSRETPAHLEMQENGGVSGVSSETSCMEQGKRHAQNRARWRTLAEDLCYLGTKSYQLVIRVV